MYERGAMPAAAREMAGRLGRLRALRREVNLLSQRAAEVRARARGGAVRVAGLPFRALEKTQDFSRELSSLHERLVRRRQESMEELGGLYAFIDDIPDAQLRLIFTHRYIDGLTWQQVARKIGHYDEQMPRKKHNAFLRQITRGKEPDGEA